MILVLNLNASVDRRYMLDTFEKGEVMRARSVENTAGGKGLHVANVLHALGADAVTTGFLGGKAGEFIEERMAERGLAGDFTHVADETRSCLAILTAAGEQTEILEPGPMVTADELAAFRAKYRELLRGANLVVGSGSIPQGVPKSIYADLTGRRAETEEDAQHAICALLDAGLPLACVSLGADGSLLGVAAETPDDPPQLYRVKVPHIDCKNPVGSGDSFVGGFAAALASGKSPQEALRLAAACGTANAMEEESGSVTPETVQALLPKIAITKVS